MKCLCNVRCRLIKDVDMFGKEPELYYNGRQKKTSWVGRIFSFSFVLVYFGFFLYKLIRMMKKTDVTFYDTFAYSPEPPYIPITHENFYFAFALEDPISYDAFVNESIYTVKGYFKRAEKKGDEFEWQVHELEVEHCQLEKFGKTYQDIFKKIDLKNYYCLKDINNFALEGHFSYYLYSFFYIQFFPCMNDTTSGEQGKCGTLEEINYYLKNTFITFEIEDVELTPKDYHSPTRPRSQNVYTTVGKKLFQEIHAYLEVVDIQTDLDWLGFDEIQNIKSEKHLKYDETFIMSNVVEDDIYKTGDPLCDVTLKLSDEVRTQRRIYTKFVTILGDVGGFMEVMFTLFRIVSSFSVDILYEISLVNHLFKFNTHKKEILLRINDGEEVAPIDFKEKDIEIVSLKRNTTRKKTKGMGNKQSIYNIKYTNADKHHTNLLTSKTNLKNIDKEISVKNKIVDSHNERLENTTNINNNNNNYNNNTPSHSEDQQDQNNNYLNKVRLNRACVYLLFCYARRRKIIDNVLIDEGMDFISKRLDIFNLFEKIYKVELRNDKLNNKIISMSDECKTRLKLLELENSPKDIY